MRNFLPLLFLLVIQVATAQQVLEGTVTDAQTKEPVIGAIVASSREAQKGTATDEQGKYRLTLQSGSHTITIAAIGYKAAQRAVELTGNSTTLDVALDADKVELGPVVVSAGRFEQNLGEVTVSMEVLQPQIIQDKNTLSMDEILQQSPGVSIVDDEPQIRSGSGYSFGAGSRVQVLVDDLPMLSGDAGKTSWGFLPLENLSQVEIIKGASSVLYGSSALSGVINMRTAYPTDKPKTRVSVFHGMYSSPGADSAKYWNTNGMRSGVFFLHSQKIGNWDVVLGGNVLGDDGALGPIKDTATGKFTDNFNLGSVDRYNAQKRFRGNANLRYRFKKLPGLSAGVNTNWMSSESMATLIWENSGKGLYGAFQGSATRTKQLLGTVDPFITYINNRGSKHSLRSRWQSLDNNNDNNQGNFSDVFYTEYQYQQTGNRWGIKDLVITGGAVSIYTTSRGQLYLGGNENGENTARNYAGYLQVDKKFKERLNVSAGVRYEYFAINSASQQKPVFRAGANYRLGLATFLRASYGQGYRFPSIAEKFIVTSLGAVKIFPNPELQPETSYNAEFGIKQGFKIKDFKGFIDVAFFQQEMKNFIEFTFGQWDTNPNFNNMLGLGFKSVNTGTARVRGAEISIMGEGNTGSIKWQTLIGYTYTVPVSATPDLVYARSAVASSNPFLLQSFANATYSGTSSDASNNILKYRLQHLIRADVAATWKHWNVGVSFRYNSHMQNIDKAFEQLEQQFPAQFNPGIIPWRAQHKKGDYVFDARMSYAFGEMHKLAVVVSNVLNRTYAIRPLAIEDPRVITLQYTLTIQ